MFRNEIIPIGANTKIFRLIGQTIQIETKILFSIRIFHLIYAVLMNHVRGLIIISYFFSILTNFRLIGTKSPLNREFVLCLERGSRGVARVVTRGFPNSLFIFSLFHYNTYYKYVNYNTKALIRAIKENHKNWQSLAMVQRFDFKSGLA